MVLLECHQPVEEFVPSWSIKVSGILIVVWREGKAGQGGDSVAVFAGPRKEDNACKAAENEA